jgi:uncharacterized LabA/DUF88 family protein
MLTTFSFTIFRLIMQKIAFLIDGGFFLTRMRIMFPNGMKQDDGTILDLTIANNLAIELDDFVKKHLIGLNNTAGAANPTSLLYRIFYYDASPYINQENAPISGKPINYAKSKEAIFRSELHENLKTSPYFAVRLGHVARDDGWVLKPHKQKEMIAALKRGETLSLPDFTDDDFQLNFKQKAVDMRIGLDIASLTLKKHVDTIVLVTGDADFAPAAKLARVEGLRVIVDMMGQEIPKKLIEHVDLFMSSYKAPSKEYLSHIDFLLR